MQSERMREEPEEKMGGKFLTNLQAECIPSSEPKHPVVSHTGWEEVNGIEVPPSFFSENHPLGLGSGFSAFPSGDTSSGLRELSPLVRPLSQQLSPTPAYHEPLLPAGTALATVAKTEKTGSACKQGRRSLLPS